MSGTHETAVVRFTGADPVNPTGARDGLGEGSR
jgi:hypothetical protein